MKAKEAIPICFTLKTEDAEITKIVVRSLDAFIYNECYLVIYDESMPESELLEYSFK